ncbi:F-box protein [Platanthera guangdongensis]|uniref:F-box protein n=1 Tax=Platanthera guangdongensis TaxID=2320717 RepID=A0ABR2MKR3_9ASPA
MSTITKVMAIRPAKVFQTKRTTNSRKGCRHPKIFAHKPTQYYSQQKIGKWMNLIREHVYASITPTSHRHSLHLRRLSHSNMNQAEDVDLQGGEFLVDDWLKGPCNPINSEDSPKEVLPFDVIIQILARLPVESIFRFRCVCRSWRRLPLEKHFILLYSVVWSKKLTTLLHIVDFRRNRDVLFDVDEFDGYSRRSFDFFQFRVAVLYSRRSFYVCNLITRESRLLLRSTETEFRRTLVNVLAFDQCSWQFRVFIAGLHGRSLRSLEGLKCMVFCSTTNFLSKFDSNYPYKINLSVGFNGHVFCNNSMHLLKRSDNSMCHMLVLDLSAQVWREILLPEILKKCSCGGRKTCLLEFEGSLCLIHRWEARMDIWVMKDYATSNWVLIDSVSLRPILKFGDYFHPVSANSNFVISSCKQYILVYGMKNKAWRKIFPIREGVDLRCPNALPTKELRDSKALRAPPVLTNWGSPPSDHHSLGEVAHITWHTQSWGAQVDGSKSPQESYLSLKQKNEAKRKLSLSLTFGERDGHLGNTSKTRKQ